MHNWPGRPLGSFAIRPGPFFAAADLLEITVTGRGGHAAKPNECADPTLAGAAIMMALQSIVSRNVDPVECAVVSCTTFQAGDTFNVIPQTARLNGTARTLDADIRTLVETRITEMVPAIAAGYGCTAEVIFRRGYPVTVNHAAQTDFAIGVAAGVAGEGGVDGAMPPMMGGEDFSYMLNERPGAMIFIGNGPSAGLHHPEFDFDDRAIPYGCSYWARLVETALAA
jgi:hippurate hydrolase